MRTLLIVDDNVELASLLAVVAEVHGFSPRVANTGLQALELMEREKPEAALVDLHLPDIAGQDLLKALRSRGVVTFAMSGVFKGEQYARAAVETYGARAYFEKPFPARDAMVKLAALVSAPPPEPAPPPAPPPPAPVAATPTGSEVPSVDDLIAAAERAAEAEVAQMQAAGQLPTIDVEVVEATPAPAPTPSVAEESASIEALLEKAVKEAQAEVAATPSTRLPTPAAPPPAEKPAAVPPKPAAEPEVPIEIDLAVAGTPVEPVRKPTAAPPPPPAAATQDEPLVGYVAPEKPQFPATPPSPPPQAVRPEPARRPSAPAAVRQPTRAPQPAPPAPAPVRAAPPRPPPPPPDAWHPAPAPEAHAASGDAPAELKPGTVTGLLSRLARRRATGELRIKRGDVLKVVGLREGQIVFAASNLSNERLPRWSLRTGKLPANRVQDLQAAIKKGQRTGDALVALGIVKAEDRIKLVASLIREIVWTVLDADGGEALFTAKAPDRKGLIPLVIDPIALVLQGYRHVFSLVRLRELVDPEKRYVQVFDAPWSAEDLPLGAPEKTLLAATDGTKSLEDLMLLSEMDERQTLVALLALMHLGMIEARAPTARHYQFG